MSDQRAWDPDKAFYVPEWVIDGLLGVSADPPAFHVVATTPTHVTMAWGVVSASERATMERIGLITASGWKVHRDLLPPITPIALIGKARDLGEWPLEID